MTNQDPVSPLGPAMSFGDARAMLAQMQQDALVAEAEDTARGARYLTVETGHPENDEEMALVTQVTETAWAGRDGARTTSVGGGGDYLTIRVTGPNAELFVDELAALAQRLDPGWWHLRRAAR